MTALTGNLWVCGNDVHPLHILKFVYIMVYTLCYVYGLYKLCTSTVVTPLLHC